MTEAGEKWVKSKDKEFVNYTANPVTDAEFWLRAFCETLESRVDARPNGMPVVAATFRFFQELKNELLGEK